METRLHEFEGKTQEEVTKLLAPLPSEKVADRVLSVQGWIAMVQDTVLGLYELGLAQGSPDLQATYWFHSFMTFIEEVLRPRLPIPDFHKYWYWWALTNRAYLNLAPRGHGKTTAHDIHYPLWRIITDHNIRIILACETSGVAGLMVGTCRDHLDRNYLLKECFGELNPRLHEPAQRSSARQVWSKGGFMVERTDFTLKDATYTPLGKREATLTRRGDIIIVDDPVPEKRAATYDYAQDILWVEGELYPVLEDKGQIIVVGTLKDNRDIYSHIERERSGPEGRISYKVYQGDAEVHDNKDDPTIWHSLWPEKWPEEDLKDQRFMMGTIKYNRNYRNIIISEEDSLFPMAYFTGGMGADRMVMPGCYESGRIMRASHTGDELLKVIGVDPWAAMKVDKRSKYWASSVLGLSHDGNIYVLDLWRGHPKGKAQNLRIADLWDRYAPDCIAVESNSAQAKLIQDLWHEYADIAVVAANTGVNKIDPDVGIESMSPYFERGQFRLPTGDPRSVGLTELLVEELHHWPSWLTSDLLMATWIAWKRLMLLARIRRWITEDYQVIMREELPAFDIETIGQTFRADFPIVKRPPTPRVEKPRYARVRARRW